jgi:REP element-mobilizing transposase RayT
MPHAHSIDLRQGRHSEIGRAYLVTAVCEGRARVFADWRLGRLVVQEFRLAQELGLAESLAWVVMPDHFHWLCVLRKGSLARLMQRVKSRSAIAVNRATQGKSALWQAGYHDHALRDDEDIKDVARYIVANPVRAGLVSRLGDYSLWDAVWL